MKNQISKEFLDKIAGGRLDCSDNKNAVIDLCEWMMKQYSGLSTDAQNQIVMQYLQIVDATSDDLYTLDEAKAILRFSINEAKKREGIK